MVSFLDLQDADTAAGKPDEIGISPVSAKHDDEEDSPFSIWSSGMAYFPTPDTMEVDMYGESFSLPLHGVGRGPYFFGFTVTDRIPPFWAMVTRIDECEPRCRSRRLAAQMLDKWCIKVTLTKLRPLAA